MTTASLPLGLAGATLDVIETPDLLDAPGFRPALLTADEIRVATHQDTEGLARYKRYVLYSDYYEGRQRDPRTLTFNDDDLARERTFTSRHNLCAPIVDIQVERLTVSGFRVSDADGKQQAATDDLATLLWRWWQMNRMDARARMAHRQSFKFGDAYLLVQWDTERNAPRYCVEDPRQIVPIYDPNSGALVCVYKAWLEVPQGDPANGTAQARVRINKYQPGLIEKFVGVQSGLRFAYYTDDRYPDGRSDGGIIPWIDREGNPLPVPIVHFKHVAEDEGDFGRSDLSDVVPMQDEFNRRVWATGQAAVFDGARIKYGINVKPFVDPRTGEEKSPPLGPNVFWYLSALEPDQAAQVATLDTGDLGQLQEVADRELKTIAGLTGIPMHLIWPAGGLPSGESLKTAEGRLVSKLGDRTITYGNAHEDVQYLAIKLANTFGGMNLAEDFMITTQWASVESRSALSEEQVIALRVDDLSWHQRMMERGYTEEQIARIEREREEEKASEPPPPPVVVAAEADEVAMTPEAPVEDEDAA